MCALLVDHDTVEDTAVFERSTGNLLDLRVALQLQVELVDGAPLDDGFGCDEGEVRDEVAPAEGEFGTDAGL